MSAITKQSALPDREVASLAVVAANAIGSTKMEGLSVSNRLTPSEIESLREDKRATVIRMRELLALKKEFPAHDPTRLTPEMIAELRAAKTQSGQAE